jgi:CheY-like chemotaxis protein
MPLLNLENKKVLVVEDDDMSFLYINQLLLLTKSAFDREKSGIDALEQFRKNRDYDLILMDIQLPDMDGKQVTRAIRAIDADIPIIAQTASRSTDEKDSIIEAGCSAVITKPFSMEEFYKVISKFLKI